MLYISAVTACFIIFLCHTSKEEQRKRNKMSTCNHLSSAAAKVTMIRRVKNRKCVSNENKTQAVTSVLHQSNSQTPQISVEVPKYMNTYRLEPKNKFNCTLAHLILEEVVNKYCYGFKYDPLKCSSRVQTIAGEIMKRIKKLEFDRYRFIVLVEIGSNKNQEIETVTKFFWDASRDRHASYNLKSGSMFACATIFAVYLD